MTAAAADLAIVLGRLTGQAIHQVEIDRANTSAAQPVVGRRDYLEWLNPVDPGLDLGIKGLDAQADSRDASLARRVDEGLGQHARIEFGGDFGPRPQAEPVGHVANQVEEIFGREGVRTSTPEMQVGGTSVGPHGVGPEVHLQPNRLVKGPDAVVLVKYAGVAPAVPTHPLAEWHMNVGGDHLVRPRGRQPTPDLGLALRRLESNGGRIAGVSREIAFSV